MEDKIQKIVDENQDVWSSKASLFSWIRGGIRGGLWNKHPIKLKVLKKNRIKILNPNPSAKIKYVWGAECSICKKEHVIKNIQVDHIHGGDYSLKSVNDIKTFFEQVILITEDDLRIVCKDCNSTLTYAKRNNLSYKEAFITKYVIQLIKDKNINQFFIARSLSLPKSLIEKRKIAIELLLKENKDD